jgi:hypothetical protein
MESDTSPTESGRNRQKPVKTDLNRWKTASDRLNWAISVEQTPKFARTIAPMNLATIVANFTSQLTTIIERETLDRARAAVVGALGAGNGRGPSIKSLDLAGGRPRKKAPKQLCPVPGCKNPAAPVFGMVCAKHKDVAKTKIKKYREARRAKKQR